MTFLMVRVQISRVFINIRNQQNILLATVTQQDNDSQIKFKIKWLWRIRYPTELLREFHDTYQTFKKF